jgi:hypothetical protein
MSKKKEMQGTSAYKVLIGFLIICLMIILSYIPSMITGANGEPIPLLAVLLVAICVVVISIYISFLIGDILFQILGWNDE